MTVDEVLAALADPTRRRLLDLVADSGETTATAMADRLPVTRQALVQHLSVLENVGLVASRRVGRERRYAVRSDQLTATARWMTDLAGQWDQRLAAIKSLAESTEQRPPESGPVSK